MNSLKLLTPLSVVNLVALFCVTQILPEIVPFRGSDEIKITGYAAMVTGGILLAFLLIIRRSNAKLFKSRKSEDVVLSATTGFMIVFSWMPVWFAKYDAVLDTKMYYSAPLFVTGVFMTIISNYFARIKQNYWIGIRTPWTLKDETVWNKTHKLGGYTCVTGGIVLCLFSILSFIFDSASLAKYGLIISMGLFLIPCAYSYVEYRNIQSNKPLHQIGQAATVSQAKKSSARSWIIWLTTIVPLIVVLAIVYLAYKEPNVVFESNAFKLKGGIYGVNIPLAEISEINLIGWREMPAISIRTNGISFSKVHRGKFRTTAGDKIHLSLNRGISHIIRIVDHNGHAYYLNMKNADETKRIFDIITSQIGSTIPKRYNVLE